MSNPHDEPGRRPPPPRQGEPPSSYPGAPPPQYHGDPSTPPPYHGDPGTPPPYHGDPHAYQGPPPQTGAWQAPPPGYGPPQPASAGYVRGRGMLSNLFDFTFDHMVTPQMIRGAYLFGVLFTSVSALVWLIIGFYLYQYGWLLTVIIVLFTPPLWLVSLIGTRMFLEFLINQFKITEHLKAMRERDGLR
jgi:hypothetical protein